MLATAIISVILASQVFCRPHIEVRGDHTTYAHLVYYFKYASSSYAPTCPKPNGNNFITRFNAIATDTQGFIARDDSRKEIVAAFRGTSSLPNILTDVDNRLKKYTSEGVNASSDAEVHSGFLNAYNSVASKVISTIRAELKNYPDYKIVTSGHSLGGALSSLAAVSLKSNFPETVVTMYTYGQPRTGNHAYASFVDFLFPDGYKYRSTHTNDGVPTSIPESFGYRHHGTEYWSYSDPVTADTTRACSGDEDTTCSNSIPSGGINPAHLEYFNIAFTTPFCD